MLAFTLRKFGATLIVLPATFLMVFALLRVTGNPIELALGDRLTPEELAGRISAAGLDLPLHEQFLEYVSQILRGDFGLTFDNQPVLEMILSHLTATAEVTAFGLLLLALTIAIAGTIAAWNAGSLLDRGFSVLSIVSFALPGFLGAVVIRETANLLFPKFETIGRLSLDNQITWQIEGQTTGFVTLDGLLTGNNVIFLDGLAHLVLPGIALTLVGGTLVRVFRDSLVNEFAGPQVQSAMKRGVSKRRAFFFHAFVPALPPVLAGFGITAGALVTGVVFVERVFEIRGLGYLLVDAVLQRDFMLVQGIFVVTFTIVVLINTVVDILIAVIDKRQREQLL